MLPILPFERRGLSGSGDMLIELENEMNKVMDGFFGRSKRELSFVPSMDVVEQKTEYLLKLEVPGLSKGDIEISVEDGVLSISGEKKFEKVDEKDGRYHIVERRYGKFTRSVNIPRATDVSKISADFKDGVLTILLPKKPEAKPFKVEIS